MTDPTQPRGFSLLRAFALWSAAVIVVIAACAALALTRFVSERMLSRDATLTAEFMQTVIFTPEVVSTLSGQGQPGERGAFVQQMREMAGMPDVIRANVYERSGRIAWSSDPRLVGQTPGDNDELAEAWEGKLVVHRGRTDGTDLEKPEHRFLAASAGQFVEIYVPVLDGERRVVGAVEMYRIPRTLFATLRQGTQWIWASAALAAVVLFGALFWIVRRGDRTLRWQQTKLLEAGRLAAVGEMAASVAHGIRNPLASIRSSAELALDADPRDLTHAAHDIISAVDRAERWVADLLRCAVPPAQSAGVGTADAALAATTAFEQFREEFARRGAVARLEIEPGLPRVAGSTDAILQVIASLLSNATEAVRPGDPVDVRLRRHGRLVRIVVEDRGPGIAAEDRERVFEPYFTSKARGLGLGLPLARSTIERLGGRLTLASEPGRGTTVTIDLPVADADQPAMERDAR
jgi:signal transduction histidine kinase